MISGTIYRFICPNGFSITHQDTLIDRSDFGCAEDKGRTSVKRWSSRLSLRLVSLQPQSLLSMVCKTFVVSSNPSLLCVCRHSNPPKLTLFKCSHHAKGKLPPSPKDNKKRKKTDPVSTFLNSDENVCTRDTVPRATTNIDDTFWAFSHVPKTLKCLCQGFIISLSRSSKSSLSPRQLDSLHLSRDLRWWPEKSQS